MEVNFQKNRMIEFYKNITGKLFIALLSFIFSGFSVLADVNLTKEEKKWIEENPIVNFTGDPNWLPYEFFKKDGTYVGIVSEHLKLIEKLTGLKFNAISVSSWSESLKIAVDGKVSVISGDAADIILNNQFKPIDTYSKNPVVIIMDAEHNYVQKLELLKDKKIAIIKGYGYTSDIFKKYPDIKFIEVENIQEGLAGVADGRIDTMLSTIALATYTISDMGLSNIKVVGKTNVVMGLTLFVAKNKPILHRIINKALKSISLSDSNAIYQHWIKQHYIEKYDYALIIKPSIGFSILLVVFYLWNRRLLRKIELRIKTELENKKIEKQLRSQAKIIDQIHDSVIATDLNGMITKWNKGSDVLFGHQNFEVMGKHVSLVYPESEYKKLEYEIIPVLIKKGAYDIETKLLHKSGNIFFGHISLSMLYDDEGVEVGMIGYTIDVTKEKLNAIELEESSRRFKAMFESIPDAVVYADSERNINMVNKAAIKLFDYNESELQGKKTKILYSSGDDFEELGVKYYNLKGVVRNMPTIISYKTKNGFEFPGETLGTTVKALNGDVLGYLGIIRDITERQLLESKLENYRVSLEEKIETRTSELTKARDEAEHASEAKSEFLSSMSHELRTPMNAILGFAQILDIDAEKLTKIQAGNVKEIIFAGHHLMKLINDVLDLTRIESGKLDVYMEKVSVDDVIEQSLSLIHPLSASRQMKIINNISGKGYVVKADNMRLKQAILNLLSNAVKYNNDSGCIKLDSKIVVENRLRISIADNGDGISEEDLNRLFTPFERLDKSNNVEGTGIGLVICKQLVTLMAGTIGVESILGEGSTFWIEFELVDQKIIHE